MNTVGIHAFFSTGGISLLLSVSRQTVVLFIPGTDEGSALVMVGTALTHKSVLSVEAYTVKYQYIRGYFVASFSYFNGIGSV